VESKLVADYFISLMMNELVWDGSPGTTGSHRSQKPAMSSILGQRHHGDIRLAVVYFCQSQ